MKLSLINGFYAKMKEMSSMMELELVHFVQYHLSMIGLSMMLVQDCRMMVLQDTPNFIGAQLPNIPFQMMKYQIFSINRVLLENVHISYNHQVDFFQRIFQLVFQKMIHTTLNSDGCHLLSFISNYKFSRQEFLILFFRIF